MFNILNMFSKENGAGREPVITLVLRQLKFPLSNINMLAYN